jgi:hypothetical protein
VLLAAVAGGLLITIPWLIMLRRARTTAAAPRAQIGADEAAVECDCGGALSPRLAALEASLGGCDNVTHRAGVAALIEEMTAVAQGARL